MIRFGTGGWREIIGDGFTKANVSLLAKALACKMKDENCDKKGICIGYDRRFLSAEAAHWAAEVFAAEKVPCRVIDRSSPTPLIMYAVKILGLDYGMSVTASHNPAIYNGVKVFTAGGRDASETVTKDIERYIERESANPILSLDYEKGKQQGIITEINPFNEYIDSIIAAVDMQAIRDRHLKVVLDPMFGVSQTSLRTILMTARCDLDVINDRHDTLFGGRLPTPNVRTLRYLTEYVTEHNCDIGIATDGDADRLGIIDDTGRFLHPNEILVMLYYYLVRYKGWKGSVVRNIATTHILDRVAASFGEQCYEVPVGFKYISSKMDETGAIIGGESSGGLTVRGHISGKDGIYAASLLVEMLAITGKQLSQVAEEIAEITGRLYMAEHDYRFAPERKSELADTVYTQKKLPDMPLPVEKVSYMDGCKVYFKNGGWVVVRFSGTEPLLRIFSEMESMEEAEKICALFAGFLQL